MPSECPECSTIHTFECPPRVLNATNNLGNQAAFVFPEKSQKWMLFAIQIAAFYNQTTCVVTHTMIQWKVLKNFSVESEALKEITTPPDITATKSTMPIAKFLKHFLLH